MRSPVTDESKFWQLTSAAEPIFTYRREHFEISRSPWGFDRGSVSDDMKSAWASFSCVAVSGWGNDTMTISAGEQPDGSWKISHKVTRAT